VRGGDIESMPGDFSGLRVDLIGGPRSALQRVLKNSDEVQVISEVDESIGAIARALADQVGVKPSDFSLIGTYSLFGRAVGTRRITVGSGDGFSIKLVARSGMLRAEIRSLKGGGESGERWEVALRPGELAIHELSIDGASYILAVRGVAATSIDRPRSGLLGVASPAHAKGVAPGGRTLELTSAPAPSSELSEKRTSTWGRVKILYR